MPMPVEQVEQALALVARGLQLFLEGLSVATVLVGMLATLRQGLCRRRSATALPGLSAARLRFGSWLSMALEFQLGADIVATTAGPNRDNLIRLAVVAVIRTFLNVFLVRELDAAQRLGTDPKAESTG
jgi:uncharacterized membrane protein